MTKHDHIVHTPQLRQTPGHPFIGAVVDQVLNAALPAPQLPQFWLTMAPDHARLQIVQLKKENKKLVAEVASMAAELQAASQERDDLMAQQTFDARDGTVPVPAQVAATMSLAGIDKDVLQVKVS